MAAVGTDSSRVPEALPPASELGRLTDEAARETGLPSGLPVYAGGGDGQCAGLGTGCTRPDRAYVNLGTPSSSGVWSPDYLYSPAWRTEIAGQGEGYILENCFALGLLPCGLVREPVRRRPLGRPERVQRSGGRGTETADRLRGRSRSALLVGVMDPYWDMKARGVIVGLGPGHRPVHIHRAILEASP
jgi:xylulokinase